MLLLTVLPFVLRPENLTPVALAVLVITNELCEKVLVYVPDPVKYIPIGALVDVSVTLLYRIMFELEVPSA